MGFIAGRTRDRQLKSRVSTFLYLSRRHKLPLEFRWGENRDFFDSELNSNRVEEGVAYRHTLSVYICTAVRNLLGTKSVTAGVGE